MILLIARRELLGHLRSTRLRALFALVVLLLAVGTYVDVRRYQARVRFADALDAMRVTASALPRDDAEGMTARFGWRAGRLTNDPALRAIRPPVPASVFALGADLATPGYWQFGTEGAVAGPAPAAESAAAGSGGAATLDLTFVVRVVLSLAALLVAADTIAGDRERGTLRTLFAAPVSRVDIVLGKYLGGVLALGVPLLTGAIAAAIVVATTQPALLTAGLGVRVLLLAAASGAYLAAMLALGTCISARCRDAQTAVVVLVATWATVVIVVPAAAPLAAAVVRPVASDEVVAYERTESVRQLETERARALAAIWEQVSGTGVVPDATTLTPRLRRQYDEARRGTEQEFMRRKRTLLRTTADDRRRQIARQLAVLETIDVLSPPAAFAMVASAVAGTSTGALSRWQLAVDEHQQRLERTMFDRQFGTELFVKPLNYLRVAFLPNANDPSERLPRYDELPAFAPPAADLGADVRAALPLLGVLVTHTLVFLALAGVAVLRMDV